tara:strand:- start:3974 stop:4471 length:498 start_codon:yes stop_codon:yes gene_type:complete
MAGNITPEPAQIDKENNVLALRAQSFTWRAIAEQVGYASGSGALKAYMRAVKRQQKEPVEAALYMELERLDEMQSVYWEPAIQGNMRAGEFVLKIMDRRAKFLGLDAPTKIQAEVVNYEGGAGSIDAEVDRIARIIDRLSTDDSITISEQSHQGKQIYVEEPLSP